jgi:hypothetical protein
MFDREEATFRELLEMDRKAGIKNVPKKKEEIMKMPIKLRGNLLKNYGIRFVDEELYNKYCS